MAGANASTAGSSAAIPQLMTPVERVVENLRQVAMLTTDFESSGQEALLGKIDQVVQDMVLIDKLKDKCDASVPAELLDFVDRGEHPEAYLKACYDRLVAGRDSTKKELEIFQALQKELEGLLAPQ